MIATAGLSSAAGVQRLLARAETLQRRLTNDFAPGEGQIKARSARSSLSSLPLAAGFGKGGAEVVGQHKVTQPPFAEVSTK